ncbi:tetratricopeptide repeat protein [Candidatus Dojkabacteria bacterium]|jgi:tetratricopeptide (TPR) repeat protein|nr:tetratricopeptide repeat protein [Candidatus Dojkabacteria bacterium]
MIKFKKHNILKNIILATILLFSIGGFLFISSPNKKIYDQYYLPYYMITDNKNIDDFDSIHIAFNYAQNKDYNNAINTFEKIIQINNNNILAHFYLGVVYQEIGNYKNAAKEYEIVSKANNIFVDQANWYSALCYLKFNKEKAYNRFEEISEKNEFYHSLSNKILLTLKINNNLINLLLFLIIIGLMVYVRIRQIKFEKMSNQLIVVLTRNVEFLNEIIKKKEIQEIKNIINIYSQCQVISKVANCDYVSFFKYDYSKKIVSLNFMLSVDKNGSMIYNSLLYDIDNLLTLNLKFNYDDLYFKNINEVEDNNIVYVMKKNDISKFYYQNIYKDLNTPIGFIALSFKDDKYIIPNEDKVEIIRMIEKIKYYL